MRDFIKKYEVWIFLIFAPVFNALLVIATGEGLIPNAVYTHGRFYALLIVLVFLVKYTRGNEGIKEMFKPILKWRVHPKWYIFSLTFVITLATITLLLKSLYTGVEFTTLINNYGTMNLRRFVVILIWAFVGEVVWVSYSIRELKKVTNTFYASQIVGLFWGLWWVPVVYFNVSVVLDVPMWPAIVNVMGAAGMCAFVYEKTKSGICVLVIQFMLNLSLLVIPISPRLGGVSTYIAFVIIYYITMLVFMYFMNPKKKIKTVE